MANPLFLETHESLEEHSARLLKMIADGEVAMQEVEAQKRIIAALVSIMGGSVVLNQEDYVRFMVGDFELEVSHDELNKIILKVKEKT